MSLPTDLRRKMLLFRAWHRGTREGDLLLGAFAEAHLAGFDAAQLDRFAALLECPDADLFDWIGGRAPPPPTHDHDVTRLLLAFRYAPQGGPHPDPSPPAGEGAADDLPPHAGEGRAGA